MVVWSVEGTTATKIARRWFETEKQAADAMRTLPRGWRTATGPHRHRIDGRAGLVSFLETYTR